MPVSTHAPLWGATTDALDAVADVLGFNPRAPMGRDNHQPLRLQSFYCFNPRAPMGRDFCNGIHG